MAGPIYRPDRDLTSGFSANLTHNNFGISEFCLQSGSKARIGEQLGNWSAKSDANHSISAGHIPAGFLASVAICIARLNLHTKGLPDVSLPVFDFNYLQLKTSNSRPPAQDCRLKNALRASAHQILSLKSPKIWGPKKRV